MHYTCAIHTERNATNTSIFNNCINVTNGGGNIDLIVVIKKTVIIKSTTLYKRNYRCSGSIEAKVYIKYGDVYVTTYQNKHIAPATIFYSFQLTITSNMNLTKGPGNGSKRIRLPINCKMVV